MSQHRISVCPVVPGRNDATSWYRGLGPLFTLNSQVDWLDIVFMRDFDWTAMKLIDVLFMQRPASTDEQTIAKLARQHGRALWVDYDDDLTAVPMENFSCYGLYMNDAVQGAIRNIIRLASVVSVTTPYLRDRLANEAGVDPRKFIVIPNAIDDTLPDANARTVRVQDEKKPRLLFWRGSVTHHRDLFEEHAALIAASERLADKPDWKMAFMGYSPWHIAEHWNKRRVEHVPASADAPKLNGPIMYKDTGIAEFYQVIKQERIRAFLFPLHDNHLNRAKSNNAWIEAAYAGAVTIAPNWPEWQKPGVITYGPGPTAHWPTFQKAVGEVMEVTDQQASAWAYAGWAYVYDHLRLSRVNKLRADLLKNLQDGGRFRL